MASGSSSSERDPLILTRSFSLSYESFVSSPPEAFSSLESAESANSDAESFTDALSCVSSTKTGTIIATKAKTWLSNSLQQGRGWLANTSSQIKSAHDARAGSYVLNFVAVVMMGIAAAVVACIVDVGESRIFDWKYGICTVDWTASKPMCCSGYTDCPQWKTWSAIVGVSDAKLSGFNFAVYLFLVLLLAGLSHAWTRLTRARRPHRSLPLSLGNDGKETLHSYFAAAGSGVSDVKQAIYGVRDDAPWTVSTLIMKILGLVMSTSSGLCVGKEGPYVHLAASAANLVNQSVPARLRISARKALSIGSAAGMAVAFGTPMTGAAFVIEDFGQSFTSSFFAVLFGGGVVAVSALTAFGPYGGSRAVPWQVRYTTSWSVDDASLFFILGAAAGVVAAIFIGSVRLWSRSYRQLPQLKRWPILDVMIVALVTALSSFWAKYLRFGTAELLSELTRESVTAQTSNAGVATLGLSLLVKLGLTVITTGLQIPQGIYMPSMAIGAMLGRCIGELCVLLLKDGTFLGFSFKPDPAVYAMAGAGAVMAGTTRLHLSIIILVFETTHSWEYIVPFAISICTAKAVAAYIEPESIYDLFSSLHGQPSLATILDTRVVRVEDVWEPQDPRTPCLNLASGFEAQVHSLKMILDAAEIAGSQYLPILKQKTFIGCISNQSLREVLKTLDDSAHVVLDQEKIDVVCMSVIGEGQSTGALDGELTEEQMVRPISHLVLHQPAVFSCCSTLSAIHAYFKESDAEYICVTRHGITWTVVTREILAEWSISVPGFRRSSWVPSLD